MEGPNGAPASDTLPTLRTLGQGLTEPCKPGMQNHQRRDLTGSRMLTHSSQGQ